MNKKELKKKYIETIQPMGVYMVKNLSNSKIFIDSGLNLQGKINRCKFQLANGSHGNKSLRDDYNKIGLDNFTFEIIDYLKPKDDIKTGYADDLKLLEEMWIDKLQSFGERGYNNRKIV